MKKLRNELQCSLLVSNSNLPHHSYQIACCEISYQCHQIQSQIYQCLKTRHSTAFYCLADRLHSLPPTSLQLFFVHYHLYCQLKLTM